MARITDELGLCLDNTLLTVYFPPIQRALVFRVLGRANKGYEKYDYGPLPLSSGDSLPKLSPEGGTATVPANGVIPGRSYTPTGLSFSLTGAYDESDMWHYPKDESDRLYHVHMYVTPSILRCDLQVPKRYTQPTFQKNRIVGGVDRDFGYRRGYLEVIHLPDLVYGYRFANDMNTNFYTKVTFVYAEYLVELVKDPELVYEALAGLKPTYWYTMPVSGVDESVIRAIREAYGIADGGYPIVKVGTPKSEALAGIREVII